MITFKQKGDFSSTTKYLESQKKKNYRRILEKYASQGVHALAAATPKDTGLTSNSWDSRIVITKEGLSIQWTNSNTVSGIPLVILLHYGHGTRSGEFIEGRDFINPTMKPIFDTLSEELRKEVNT